MNTKISTHINSALILLGFLVSWYFYPQLPEQFASHWSISGEVNGYMSTFWGAFLLPLISLALFLLFLAIPKIDPLKSNIESFREKYNALITFILVFLFYIHALLLVWNMGYKIDMTRAIIPAIGFLVFFIGSILKHSKRNWFVGIRTPWTLSSDDVWRKTHIRGGKLFQLAGLFVIVGLLFPGYLLWFALIPIITVALYLVLYSYLEYKKEKGL